MVRYLGLVRDAGAKSGRPMTGVVEGLSEKVEAAGFVDVQVVRYNSNLLFRD